VLVSADLTRALPEAELEAVLAHEVAHLANGDGRVIGTALGPVSVATLKRPNNARERPEADLRERSAAVVDFLPPAEPGVSTGPFRIHRGPKSGSNISIRRPNPPKPRGEPRRVSNL